MQKNNLDIFQKLFLVGAMKSATTSAASYLEELPEIYCKIKEPNFFCTDLHDHPHSIIMNTLHSFANFYQLRAADEYFELFSLAPPSTVYLMDASTSYLYSTDAAKNIAQSFPDARIAILLRDPVARAWSEYLMNCAIGLETAPFSKAIDNELRQLRKDRTYLLIRYVLAGMYGDQVERYLDNFPRENIFIAVVDTPGGSLEKLLHNMVDFLGISPAEFPAVSRENEAKLPRHRLLNRFLYWTGAKALISRALPNFIKHPAKAAYYESAAERIPSAEADRLASIFQASNDKLRSLTGLDIAHWRSMGPSPGGPSMPKSSYGE